MPANRAVLTKVANSAFDKGAMQAIYDLTKEAGMGDFLQDLEGSSMFNSLANMDFTGLGDLGGPSEYFRGGLASSKGMTGSFMNSARNFGNKARGVGRNMNAGFQNAFADEEYKNELNAYNASEAERKAHNKRVDQEVAGHSADEAKYRAQASRAANEQGAASRARVNAGSDLADKQREIDALRSRMWDRNSASMSADADVERLRKEYAKADFGARAATSLADSEAARSADANAALGTAGLRDMFAGLQQQAAAGNLSSATREADRTRELANIAAQGAEASRVRAGLLGGLGRAGAGIADAWGGIRGDYEAQEKAKLEQLKQQLGGIGASAGNLGGGLVDILQQQGSDAVKQQGAQQAIRDVVGGGLGFLGLGGPDDLGPAPDFNGYSELTNQIRQNYLDKEWPKAQPKKYDVEPLDPWGAGGEELSSAIRKNYEDRVGSQVNANVQPYVEALGRLPKMSPVDEQYFDQYREALRSGSIAPGPQPNIPQKYVDRAVLMQLLEAAQNKL